MKFSIFVGISFRSPVGKKLAKSCEAKSFENSGFKEDTKTLVSWLMSGYKCLDFSEVISALAFAFKVLAHPSGTEVIEPEQLTLEFELILEMGGVGLKCLQSDQAEEWPNYALMAFSSSSSNSEIVDDCKKGLGYENYNEVPPPYTGNFMLPTHDFTFTGLDEFVNKLVVENCKAKSSKEDPKVVRKNDDSLIIEEWVSENEEENVIEAIRLFLAYASFKDFVVYQMDVNNAFLYGKIEEEVHVCQPPGFKDPDFPDRVYKVEKALYGLHQAFRAWYETLSTYLLENRFQRGTNEKTLSIKRHKGLQKSRPRPMETQKPLLKVEDGKEVDVHMYRECQKPKRAKDAAYHREKMLLYFVVYQMDVNNAFLYGKIEEEVHVCQPPGFKDPDFPDRVYKVEKALYGLHQAFRAWYETLSTYLLENRFQRGTNEKTLSIKRHKGLQKSRPRPMETQKPLLKVEDGKEVDVHMYRSMIGSLMYLTSLRPDIMFTVCAYARYQVNPKVSHLHVVKRNFRYLKGQPKLGLWYPKDSLFDLVAYTDSDYAGASLDIKSTIEDYQFLGCRLISWQCKKHTSVANSITKAVDALSCCGQVLWIQNQLLDYGKDTQAPQPSGLTKSVVNEAVHKELGDRLGRKIKAIDVDDEITLVNNADNEMFGVDDLGGEDVFVAEQEVVSTAITTETITTKEITLAQALEGLKTLKPKVKGIIFQEPGKSSTTIIPIISSQQSQDKGKEIMIEEPVKPKKKDQIRLDEEAAKRLVKGKEKRTGEELIQESTKKQKVEDDKEKAKLKQLIETILDEEEVAIDAIPLVVKSPRIVDWKIHKEGKKTYYQIVRADGKS
nr:putative ribonuclease H-like domain-containing protein [Tanacetum cinerariifolium]